MNGTTTTDPTFGGRARRGRIAQLLLKAMRQRDAEIALSGASSITAAEPLDEYPPDGDAPNAERVVQFLRITEAASPARIRSSLGLSRSGAFRVLQSLAHQRRVVTQGRTRMLVYRLNERAPVADTFGRN